MENLWIRIGIDRRGYGRLCIVVVARECRFDETFTEVWENGFYLLDSFVECGGIVVVVVGFGFGFGWFVLVVVGGCDGIGIGFVGLLDGGCWMEQGV